MHWQDQESLRDMVNHDTQYIVCTGNTSELQSEMNSLQLFIGRHPNNWTRLNANHFFDFGIYVVRRVTLNNG